MRRKTLDIIAREKGRWYSELRGLVAAREGTLCARCPNPGAECHHRRKRSQGGPDDAWNCVWLCHDCNTGWIEDNPTEAIRLGWTVPNGPTDLYRHWPVYRTHNGVTGWWQPTEAGWVASEPDERQ